MLIDLSQSVLWKEGDKFGGSLEEPNPALVVPIPPVVVIVTLTGCFALLV
jgi:hypothetical protein